MAAQGHDTERDWRRFAGFVLAATIMLVVSYLALAVLVDPYDTGRVTLLSRNAVRPQGPRTAAAVRGRDPAFQGAVIGNSHIQLIEPAELSRLTGVPFVQLSIPATGPAEQFTVLAWFLRHHEHPEAVVLSADDFWCNDDPDFASEHAFPFWLLGDWPSYLRGLLQFTAAQETINRVGWLFRSRRKTAAADGWWDYETNYLSQGFGQDPKLVAKLDTPAGAEPEPHRAGPFPVAARFRATLAGIPEQTPVVLVLPPVYAAAEPPSGSPREKAEQTCRNEIRRELAHHVRSTVVDWRNGRAQSRERDFFFDQTHYRLPIARALTGEIANAIIRLRAKGTN